MFTTTSRRSVRMALPLVVVAGALAVGGCGAASHPSAAISPAAISPAAAQPRATGGSPGQAAAAVSPAAVPAIATGPLVRMFSGARSRAIGTLSTKRSLVIRWNVATPPIQIYTSKGNLLVSSDRRSGTIRLGRGEYRRLRIATHGSWIVQLRATA